MHNIVLFINFVTHLINMKMYKKNILVFVLFLITILTTYAQSIENKIDLLLKKEFDNTNTGASVLVAHKGKIIYHKALGKSNIEQNSDIKTNSVFEIGSVTKQFTATSILMLVEDGKLDLNDDITIYFKDYPTYGNKITIHHLLSHTSGIESFTASDEWFDNIHKNMTQKEFMVLFKKTPMLFTPEEKYHYSNTGYFLLGMLIEKISGKSYGEFINKHIFEPIGMKNTYYGSRSKIITNRVLGYEKRDNKIINAMPIPYSHFYSAGGILSTTYDLFLWNRAIKNNKLINKKSKQLAFTNNQLTNGKYSNYGYGWAMDKINEKPTIEHNGGTFGFLSNTIYIQKEDIFVVALTNCLCTEPDSVSKKIASIVSK